jgi:hypothetical protein
MKANMANANIKGSSCERIMDIWGGSGKEITGETVPGAIHDQTAKN